MYIYIYSFHVFSIRSGLTGAVCHLSGPEHLFGCILFKYFKIYMYIKLLFFFGILPSTEQSHINQDLLRKNDDDDDDELPIQILYVKHSQISFFLALAISS